MYSMYNESERKSANTKYDKEGQNKCRRLYMNNDYLQSDFCPNPTSFIATILSVFVIPIFAKMKFRKAETLYPLLSLIFLFNIHLSL